jgi:DNA-binding beta-propeller fold protein YncE
MISGIRKLPLLSLILAAAWLTACSADAALRSPLTFQKNIQLPADRTKPGIDLLSLDPRTGRLYVPHGSNNTLDIIDVKTQKVVASVSNLPGIKAAAFTPDSDLVFVSNPMSEVTVLDASTLQIVDHIKVDGSPDAIEYDPVHDLILAGLGSTSKMAFIDRSSRKVTGTIDLPGKPELMAVDKRSGLVYLAINDKNEVVQIDPASRTIIKHYRGCDIKGPTGVALDLSQQRLFVASGTALVIIDTLLDKCLGTVDIGAGTDQIVVNEHTHHVYAASGGSKNVSVIDTISLKPLGVAGTGPSAGTIATDPTTDRVYVAVAKAGIIAVYHDP